MSENPKDEVAEFIHSLEEKRGCTVGWRTYSTFYADSCGLIREYGVFLYEANGLFWYEDFERTPQLFGIPLPKSKKAVPYVKFESFFDPNDVNEIRTVKRKDAISLVQGLKKQSKIKTANAFDKFFFQCVTEVTLKDGKILYFELPDKTLHKKIGLEEK